MLQVFLDGPWTHTKDLPDLSIRLAISDPAKHLRLAIRQTEMITGDGIVDPTVALHVDASFSSPRCLALATRSSLTESITQHDAVD
jgi:hypothetical protein